MLQRLFDRYSGNVISAMDARWVPEYGNRGELEAMIGAVISGLDGAMAQVAHMPVVCTLTSRQRMVS